MNKKIILPITILAILFLIIFTIFFTTRRISRISVSKEIIDGDFYVRDREQWEKIDHKYVAKSNESSLKAFLPENMSGGNVKTFKQLIKGYLIKYDLEKNYIVLRTLVPSTRNIYRDVMVDVKKETIIFCWPQVIEEKETKKILFDLDHTDLISIPNEKALIVQSAFNYWDQNSFFIVQLQHDVDVQKINLSKKIVWLCK